MLSPVSERHDRRHARKMKRRAISSVGGVGGGSGPRCCGGRSKQHDTTRTSTVSSVASRGQRMATSRKASAPASDSFSITL